jgi:uncharacterized protein YbjT (DUF2867 family)
MSSPSIAIQHRICVLGGTGFVGRHLVARLCADGHRVTVLTRDRVRHHGLPVLPTLRLTRADVHDERQLIAAFAGCDVVVNLVGNLNEPRDNGLGFRRAHIDLARRVLDACRKTGVTRLLHMSALNAHATQGASYYLRSKGEAEGIVLSQCGPDLKVTVFQPSLIVGAGDASLNRFADLLESLPGPFFPLACAEARFAPVWVGDVVEAMVRALDDRRSHGQRYPLCGPEQLSLRELVERVAAWRGVRKTIVGLPGWAASLQAMVLGLPFVPAALRFTKDNLRSLSVPSVSSVDGFAPFGIAPQRLEAVAPRFLANRTERGRFYSARSAVGRDAS